MTTGSSPTQPGSRVGALKYQTAHGFRRGQPVYGAPATGKYTLATEATGFDGVVGSIPSANQFELVTAGQLDNITSVLAAGPSLYLSTVAGVLKTSGTVLVYKAQSADKAVVQPSHAGTTAVTTATTTTGFASASNSGTGKAVFNPATSTATALSFKTLTSASGVVVIADNGSTLDFNVVVPAAGVDIQAIYDTAILAEPSLVGYWKCNEAMGATTLADSKGANPITTVGSLALTGRPGPMAGTGYGSIVSTGGAGGASYGSTNIGIPAGTVAASLECWARNLQLTPGVAVPWFMSIGTYGTNTVFAIRVDISQVTAYVKDAGGLDVTAKLCNALDNDWHHIVVTYDGGTAYQVFFDGCLVKSGAASATNIGVNTITLSNDLSGSTYFEGQISRAAVYSTVLSAARVRAHYNLSQLGIAP